MQKKPTIPAPAASFLPDRRAVVLGGIMAAAAAVPWMMRPTARKLLGTHTLDSIIPRAVGDWRAAPAQSLILPSDVIGAELYDATVSRSYIHDGDAPIMLVVAYGGASNRRLTIHVPEYCYSSQGFTINSIGDTPIALGGGAAIAGRTMIATRGDRRETVLYWRRIGDDLIDSRTDEAALYLREAWHRVAADGILVRLSTLDGPSEQALAALQRFAAALVDAASPLARQVLLGMVMAAGRAQKA